MHLKSNETDSHPSKNAWLYILLIDFNGMQKRLALLYSMTFGNHVYCTFISSFFVHWSVENEGFTNRSIWPIDRCKTSTYTPGQSESRNTGNEDVDMKYKERESVTFMPKITLVSASEEVKCRIVESPFLDVRPTPLCRIQSAYSVPHQLGQSWIFLHMCKIIHHQVLEPEK